MKNFSLIALLAIFSLMMVSCDKNKEDVTPQYAIAFDLQGKGTAIDTMYVEDGSLIVAPEEPTDEFYTFEGWYKDAETTTPWNFETDLVSGNTTLYAKWETIGMRSVLFNTNGLASVPKITVESGSTISAPEEPTNEDNYFGGWYKEKNCTNKWDFEKDIITKNTTLFAKWNPKYKYYGAELYSTGTFKYGRFEARMKMAYAPGCISSMFLYYNKSDETGSPLWNEIDIEVIGKDSQRFQSNIITGKKGAQITSEQMLSPGFVIDSDYHVYTIEWTPEYVAWLVDGVELRKTELGAGKEQVEDLIKEQSLRFNLWANSSTGWVGEMTHVNIPITQYIDKVTVYSYDTETKQFSEEPLWTDDFDSFNSSRWKKGDWKMDLVTERPSNVVIEDGVLLLKLTKEEISY